MKPRNDELLKKFEHEKLYEKTLLNNLPFLVWYKDTQSRFLTVNNSFAQATGINDPLGVIGKNDLDVWEENLANAYIKDDQKVMTLGEHKKVIEEINDNGNKKWFETFKSPVYDTQSQLLGTIGYAIDISDKIHYQKDLEQLNNSLEKERYKYKTLLDASSDGICLLNLDGNILECSQSFATMLAYSHEEVKILNVKDWDSKFNADQLKVLLATSLEESFIFETQYKRKNGTVFDVEISAKPIELDGVKLIYTSSRDTTERKSLNEQIQVENKKLETLVNAIPDLVWMKDDKGVYLQCNHRFEEFFGEKQENIQGKTDYDFVDKKLADFFLENDKNAMKASMPLINYETISFALDGHQEYLQTIKTAVKDCNGNILGVLGIGRDFTEVKNQQDTLAYQKQELETIFELSRDGLAVLDLETNFVKVNKAYLKLSQLSETEIYTKSCTEMTILEDQEKMTRVIAEVIKVGFVDNFEKSYMINGNKITVIMSLALLPDKKYILTAVHDITKFKLFEQQSKLASMGEMIGNIAHQWRQPLSVISTIASSIQINEELDGQIEGKAFNDMTQILNQVNYLSQTIDDFRGFLKDSEHKESLSIDDMLKSTLNIISSSLLNNNISVIKNFEYDKIIDGFKNELTQAIINILNNSKDAILEKNIELSNRFIFIDTKKIDDSIMLEIKDSGGGIDEKIMNRIFEPYFTMKHQTMGTGIGLSMARQIITTKHDGNIVASNIEFVYKGRIIKGACFRIYL